MFIHDIVVKLRTLFEYFDLFNRDTHELCNE